MRTTAERAARILHTQSVHFLTSFYLIEQEPTRIKAMKSGFFSFSGLLSKASVSLDLGRFTKVIPAFFLSQNQELTQLSGNTGKLALHGFCTLLNRFAPSPLSPLSMGRVM